MAATCAEADQADANGTKAVSPQEADLLLNLFGRKGRGGVYVLRFRVRESFAMPCGQFRQGKVIEFSAGEYLYVGRAMAQKGSLSLARRVVRHASRLGDNPPHPIRERMLTVFPQADLCDGDITPKTHKLPKWNVDHPLNNLMTDLVAVYMIRTNLNLEAALAKFLELGPGTVAFEPGLGANDVRGNTHLLRVEAAEAWWDALSAKLNKFAKLSNMWPDRAKDVLRRIVAGTSFTQAIKQSEGLYDTVGWHEVSSRLRRGRGCVLKAAGILGGLSSPLLDSDQRQALSELAKRLKAAAYCLHASLSKAGGELSEGPLGADLRPAVRDVPKSVSFAQLFGMLKLCTKFVEKNHRDVPHIRRRTGTVPRPNQMASSLREIARIEAGVDQVLAAVAGGPKELVFQPSEYAVPSAGVGVA